MRIVQMLGNRVHWLTPWQSWEEVPQFAPDIILREVPIEVQEGWILEDDNYRPAVEADNPPPPPTPEQVIMELREIMKAQSILAVQELGVDIPIEVEATAQGTLLEFAGIEAAPEGSVWEPGRKIKRGLRKTFNGEEYENYRTSHISKGAWRPDLAPELWRKVNAESEVE